MLRRMVDALVPARLGGGFRWLLSASWASNLGDGLAIAAGPLLVASQTDDPLLVAAAGVVLPLPWLLFGLQAGVIADRHDRRRIVLGVNLCRAAVLAVLAATILFDAVDIGVVLGALFVLGTAETFADITSGTLLPMTVDRADLGLANARLTFGHITVNQLAGPPIGAFLFAAGMAIPFVAQAVLVALAAVLVGRVTFAIEHEPPPPQSMRTEVVAGVRWLMGNPAVRTLTLTVMSFNVTFGAALSVLVLYAKQRLGLGEVGFGFLTTVAAVGAIFGTAVYSTIERWWGAATLMRMGLVIETSTHLTLALTRAPAVAFSIMFVFGIHESVWGTTVNTIRQRVVPTEFQGRVASVYLLALQGGLVVGAALGGVIARRWGVTGPYWFAFGGSALILLSIWRQLTNITHTPHGKLAVGVDVAS